MSKYDELKARLGDADGYQPFCRCSSCEHTRKGVREYERAAAEMHEELTNVLAALTDALERDTDYHATDKMRQLLERAKSL